MLMSLRSLVVTVVVQGPHSNYGTQTQTPMVCVTLVEWAKIIGGSLDASIPILFQVEGRDHGCGLSEHEQAFIRESVPDLNSRGLLRF